MPTEALAVEVYRSAEVVRRWERDANTPPSTVIGRLAEVLDVSADQLHELARAGR